MLFYCFLYVLFYQVCFRAIIMSIITQEQEPNLYKIRQKYTIADTILTKHLHVSNKFHRNETNFVALKPQTDDETVKELFKSYTHAQTILNSPLSENLDFMYITLVEDVTDSFYDLLEDKPLSEEDYEILIKLNLTNKKQVNFRQLTCSTNDRIETLMR